MATLYDNLQGGVITNNPLTSGATTVNSTAFQYLPTVTAPDVMYITLDPEGTNGAPEIVKVTAHTASATSVTVVRAQQNTAARSHPVSSKWVHALTDVDIAEFLKTVPDNAVTTTKIADSNVTTAKIADLNVTTGKLADSAVTTAKIADLNVTTAEIADAAVTNPKLGLTWSTDWTPTFQANGYAAVTPGNGTWDARYLRIGNMGWISAKFTTGSTTSINSKSPDINMPSGWTAVGYAHGIIHASQAPNNSWQIRLALTVGDTVHGYSTYRGSTTILKSWLVNSSSYSYEYVSQYGYLPNIADNTAGQVLLYHIGPIPLAP